MVEGLSLNASGRYTWDKIASCSVNLPFDTTPSQSFDGCQNIPSAANTKASFEKFTWAMGLDYQLSGDVRSEEHTSELQSLMRISYAVFFLKKKKTNTMIQQL